MRRAEGEAIEAIRTMTGVDISDHKAEDLQVIDSVLDADFRTTVQGRHEVESAPLGFGYFLAEVFVRNQGGRLHYPTWLQAVRALLSRDRSRAAERYCYIVLGDEKIFVFRAARESIEKTADMFSLYEFYQRYAHRNATDGTQHSRTE